MRYKNKNYNEEVTHQKLIFTEVKKNLEKLRYSN